MRAGRPGTKKDAQRQLARLLHEINTGAYVEPSRMTLSDYLDRWLEHYARANVSAKTFERYEEIVRLHLKPALGHHLLSKLQPLHIARYYSEALASGRKDGNGGLSARSVLHHHRLLRSALHQAVKWLLLPRNPADAVDPSRPQHREMRALDEAATAKLLRAAAETRLSLPVLLVVTTGLRRGEILALRGTLVRRPAGSLARRSDGLAGTRARFEIERLQRNGLVSSNGDRELLAKREAVELALAVSRAARSITCEVAPVATPRPWNARVRSRQLQRRRVRRARRGG